MFKKVVSIAVAAMLSLSLMGINSYAQTCDKKESLNNGTYKVDVSLIKADSEELSMADNALEKEASIKVKDGVKTIDITFKPLQLFGINGHLTELKYFKSAQDYKNFYPSENISLLNDVKVLSKYEDKNLQGESQSFIKTAEFVLPSDDDEIYLHTKVDAMTNEDGSGGYADVKLKIDNDNIEDVSLDSDETVLKDGVYEAAFNVYKRKNQSEYLWMSNFFDGKTKIVVNDGKMKAYFNILENNSSDAEWIKDLTAHFDMTTNDETGVKFVEEETVDRIYDNGAVEKLPTVLSIEIPEKQPEILVKANSKIPTVQDRINASWCRLLIDFDNMNYISQVDDSSKDDENTEKPGGSSNNINAGTGEEPKGNEEVLDKDNLKNGRYEVQTYLWNASKDAASMADGCLNHIAIIDVKDGKKTMSISTKPITIAGITAVLDDLKVKNSNGEYVAANAISTDVDGKPNAFSFVMPSSEEYMDVMVNPHVAIMGNAPIAARLKVDYATLKKADDSKLQIDKDTNAIKASVIEDGSKVLEVVSGLNGQAGVPKIYSTINAVETGDNNLSILYAAILVSLVCFVDIRIKKRIKKCL